MSADAWSQVIVNYGISFDIVIAMKEPIVTSIVQVCAGALFLICMTACIGGRSADHSPSEDRPQVMSAAFMGSDNAWLVTATDGRLMITRNGGASWTTVPGQAVETRFESVALIDDKRGLAANHQGQIWKTVDGGQTWVAIAKLSATKAGEWEFLSSGQMRFTDDLHGWLVETFTIWRTENGGGNWKQVFSVLDPGTKGQPGRGFFLSNEVAWATNNAGSVYRTKNAGNTWELVPMAKNESVTDIFFINERTGWLSTFGGLPSYAKIYRSDDGRETWRPRAIQNNQAVIVSLNFVSEQEGWCVGRVWTGDPKSSSGVVLHTIDGGAKWTQINAAEHEPFFDRIHFADPQHGWLFGHDTVYRTEDGGKSWHAVLSLSPEQEK